MNIIIMPKNIDNLEFPKIGQYNISLQTKCSILKYQRAASFLLEKWASIVTER